MKSNITKILGTLALSISSLAFADSPMSLMINLSCNGYAYGNDANFTVNAQTYNPVATITVLGYRSILNGTLDFSGQGSLSSSNVYLNTYRAGDGHLYGSLFIATDGITRTVSCYQY